MRIFLAVAVSSSICESLDRVIEAGKRAGGDVKWVAAKGLHVTLRFVGEVEEGLVPGMLDEVRALEGAAVKFEFRVIGLGAFPHMRRPRVIWAGIEERSGAMRGLVAAIDGTFGRLGFGPPDHPFSPHLTLGRVRSPKGLDRLRPVLERHEKDDFGTQAVASFHVMKSE